MPSQQLPHLTATRPFLADGGIETTLLFQKHIDLPLFASFPLLFDRAHCETMTACFEAYVRLAARHGTGIVLETATWRASLPWLRRLGYPPAETAEIGRRAVDMLARLRHKYPDTPVVVSGCLGPRGDAYENEKKGEKEESPRDGEEEEEGRFEERLERAMADYRPLVRSLRDAGADMISIMTVTRAEEAVAAVLLAREAGLPAWVSPTVGTDGRVPGGGGGGGRSLAGFVAEVDRLTDGYAAYFGINCAHPVHFARMLRELPEEEQWVRERIWEVRPNASEKSHEELDECEELDRGDPEALGRMCGELKGLLPNLRVVGGCCGTDEEHVGEIAKALLL